LLLLFSTDNMRYIFCCCYGPFPCMLCALDRSTYIHLYLWCI